MYKWLESTSTQATANVHRVTQSWTEDAVNWYTYDGTNDWPVNNDGGDYSGEIEASANILVGTNKWYSWDVTDLVKEWAAEIYQNYGLIVDYYGVSNHLERALEIFDKPDIEGFMKSIESELYPLEQYHKALLSYFEGIDLNDLEACILQLEPESLRADFHSDFKKFAQSMDVVLPDPRAQPYLTDLKRFGMILRAAKNRFRPEQLDLAGCGKKVQNMEHFFGLPFGFDLAGPAHHPHSAQATFPAGT